MPGKMAERYVNENNELRSRHEAGDLSLIPEVQANNQSDNPINVAFRRSEEQKRLIGTVERVQVDSEGVEVESDDVVRFETLRKQVMDEIETRIVQRFPTIAAMQEIETRIVQRCPTIADMNQMKQDLTNSLIKSEKSKRARELYDRRAAQKHELAVLEKQTEMTLKKRKLEAELDQIKSEKELEMMQKRLPVEEQYDALDERKFQRKMQLMEKERSLSTNVNNTVSSTTTEQVPGITGKFTTWNVAVYYKIYEGLDAKLTNRVFNSAWRAMLAEPYKLQPLGYVPNAKYGTNEPYFQCTDVKYMKDVLENVRREVLGLN